MAFASRRSDQDASNPTRYGAEVTAKSVTKAVIPAAGLGTRFLPATKAQPKEMLPVVDRPAIQYVVEEAVASGIDDILIITGRNKRSLEDHFDRNFELEYLLESKGKVDAYQEVVELADLADIHFVRQGEPLGLGHAVSVARKHVGNHPFVVMLGDDIMVHEPPLISEMMAVHEERGGSVVALKQVPSDMIHLYGCVEPGETDGNLVQIKGIVEKPNIEDAPSNLAVVGRYLLTPRIFDMLERTTPGAGGEIQLTDAIAMLLEEEPVWGFVFEDGRYDIGSKQDFLRATVELTLDREDLGPEFGRFLAQTVARLGLTAE